MHEGTLAALGLSRNEAKIFRLLLEGGPLSAGAVAKAAGIHRANAYDALQGLQQKVLVAHVEKNGTTLFGVTAPSHLEALVRGKQDALQKALGEARTLHVRQEHSSTRVEVMEGMPAIRAMLQRLLEGGQPIFTYGIPKEIPDIVGKDFLLRYHRKRIRKGIPMFHIYNENAAERIRFLNSLPRTEAKYLPEKYNTPATTLVCGDHLYLVDVFAQPIQVIHIQNAGMAQAYARYFQLLRKLAK
ncbi:MAG: hypothetical protein HY520_02855 [Candidatus Aenigmarchaeota archaeon]|nr:hypothetical protein [Candidatus Aenigmarchaeota archaeon]